MKENRKVGEIIFLLITSLRDKGRFPRQSGENVFFEMELMDTVFLQHYHAYTIMSRSRSHHLPVFPSMLVLLPKCPSLPLCP